MTNTQPPTPTPTSDDNGTGRLNWTLISGLFIAIIVIVAIIVLAFPSTRPNVGSPAGPSTTVARPPAPEASTDVRGQFGTPRVDLNGRRLEVPSNPTGVALPQSGGPAYTANDSEWLTGIPRGLMWQYLFNGVAMPFSTSDGPTKITNGVPEGFARTPQGAVMAAWQYTFRLAYEPDAERRKALIARLTVSDGSQAAEAARKEYEQFDGKQARTDWASNGFGPGTIPIAIRVSEFSGEYALVSYGIGTSSTATSGVRTDVQVVWRDGMWKLPLPALNTGAADTFTAGWSRRW